MQRRNGKEMYDQDKKLVQARNSCTFFPIGIKLYKSMGMLLNNIDVYMTYPCIMCENVMHLSYNKKNGIGEHYVE